MPCVGLFTLLGVLRSYVVAHVLFWDSASPRLASLAKRSLLPKVLEPPSPRSLFTHACLVSCAAGQSALLVLFVIMHAVTPASSTPAPFPRELFETLVTSRRRFLERRRREALAQGLLVRRLHPGSSCPSLHAVWLEISRRSATPPLQRRKYCLPLSPHQRLAPPCS